MDRIKLFGLNVDRVTRSEALASLERFIAEKTPHHVVTMDASMVVIAREDRELDAIINKAELITPDGAGIIWASRLLGKPITDRVSGVDLVAALSEMSARTGASMFFLGAAPGTADDAAKNLRVRYPGANIVGTQHGFFGPDGERAIVDRIKALNPDILLVAFGIPKQEKFIEKYRDELKIPVAIGIGGSFDIHSGLLKRAPMWMQRNGLEWLFRLIQNPKKLSKVMTLPRFVALTWSTKFAGRG